MNETTSPKSAVPVTGPALPWGEESNRRDSWPSAAQELLLRAALTPDERALTAWREIRSRIDIPTLDGATQALLPMLRKNLLALGVEDELLALFKGVHRYSWARSQMLLAPTMPIVEALERAGLPTLLLKGAAFVADRRLDAGMRPMNDVDVLVPSARLGEAIEVLLENGLVPVGEVPPWYVAEYAPRFVPSHGFRDALDRQLDLHWHVLHASCQEDADEDFWAAAQPIELLGVRTRALCATDELLLVVLHGLRWNALPTYRWMVDAALLCSGEIGAIDYGRLVEQARKRRVTVVLHAGLEYLRRVIDVGVPKEILRALDSTRSSRLERAELKAQMTAPRSRSALEWQVIYHQQHARRELPLGVRTTLQAHLRVERARLGIERLGDLRHLCSGGPPGAGRPDSEMAAALGPGTGRTSPRPLELGEMLDFGDAEVERERCVYGMWRAEGTGCWIAGREARLELGLAEAPRGSLVLEISADGFFADGLRSQRLGVALGDTKLGELTIEPGRPLRAETVVLPAAVLKGSRTLDLRLTTPAAVSPARLGVEDDDRQIGVHLRSMRLRGPRPYHLGEALMLGSGTGDESAPAGGWDGPEREGRWTVGGLAQLLLGIEEEHAGPLMLEFDAIPLLAPRRSRLRVEVLLDGAVFGGVSYEGSAPAPSLSRVALPPTAASGGDMLLGWRILGPCSPRSLGLSEDERELGLFIRRIVVRPT